MPPADALFRSACQVLPGGVTASARMNAALGRPFYVARGDGPRVYDLDGRAYVDMCVSHGASLLGHNNPQIKAAVARALELGVICAYETEHHVRLAQKIVDLVPSAEMVRFAGSGTETVMHGLRLARAATGREKVIKFEGHFHGYSDVLNYSWATPLDQAGPAERPTVYPQSPGMPGSLRDSLIVLPFNDVAALEAAFAAHGDQVATLVMEPINYDSGCILPQPGFLERCRELCDRYGAVLFFDEVLTAFRSSPGGAQAALGVTPDLCVLGKAFGGGMPISALAGKRAIMEQMRPRGQSEMSGTYLAHLTTVLAAEAALDCYNQPGFYERLDALGQRFYQGFQQLIDASGVPLRIQHAGPRFGMYFGVSEEVTNYRQAAQQDNALLLAFVAACIERGVYFHVAAHHGFSAAHRAEDLDMALAGIDGALHAIRQSAELLR